MRQCATLLGKREGVRTRGFRRGVGEGVVGSYHLCMADDESTMAEGKFLRLMRRGKWEYVQRMNITGVVGVVAVTDAGELLLVEQFRPPVGARCVELPAGLVGDIDSSESVETSAARELEEETGYRPSRVERLSHGVVSAGLTDETVTLCRATGLTKVSEGGGDESEEIEVHAVPLAEVPGFVKAKEAAGRLIDLKVWSALWWAGRGQG